MDKKDRFKRMVTSFLMLPKEVTLDLPLVMLTGNEQCRVENFKSIQEYTQETVQVLTKHGVLRLEGKNLLLKQITAECVTVTGRIADVRFS